jgi:hypothetical protein
MGGMSVSTGLFKRARIFVPVCLLSVLIAVFSFLMMPATSSGTTINIVTLPATDIGVSSARLNGRFDFASVFLTEHHVFADMTAIVGFAWGTNQGGPYPNIVWVTTPFGDGVSFSTQLNNLNAFTTYYYTVCRRQYSALPNTHAVYAIDSYSVVYANELSFTTLGQNINTSPVTSGDAGTTIGIPADVQFNYVYLSPAVASAGQPVKVVANVANRGSLEGGYTANLQINGHIEQTKMGTVAGNTYVPVEFTVMKDTPGTYSVDIGGQTTTFTVVAAETSGGNPVSQSQIFTIVLAILGVAAIGLLTAVIMRRRSGY